MHYIYIVKCSDNTYYTGYSNNPEKRIKAHNDGKGARYTRGRRPVQLVYYEKYENKSEALKREWEIKHLTREQKEEIISNFAGNEGKIV